MGRACDLHALGRHIESDRMLAHVAEFGDTYASYVAEVHAFRGEPNAAFDWLERAYRARNGELIRIKNDPLFASLRDDPRFDELLRKLNLPG
jgi:hypothetical protein